MRVQVDVDNVVVVETVDIGITVVFDSKHLYALEIFLDSSSVKIRKRARGNT